ncbi:MAG: 4Fe-4S binding protein [Deferribacteraceae bacterium]|jgi:ferredoxin|nr:4Fe-4S binding protein [Deferribacteraceae bacterium]
MAQKNKASVGKQCVACGACIRKCPIGAITVYKGMYAVVDVPKCRGCGACAKHCSANVISIIEVNNEEKILV